MSSSPARRLLFAIPLLSLGGGCAGGGTPGGPFGRLDPTFGNGGVFQAEQVTSDDEVRSICVDVQGRVVASGINNLGGMVVRLTEKGALDPGFAGGAPVLTQGTGFVQTYAVTSDREGRVIAGGQSSQTAAVLRLGVDGTPDASFGSHGRVLLSRAGLTQYAFLSAIAADSSDRLVLGYEDQASDTFAGVERLLPSGAIDPSFGSSGSNRLAAVPTASTSWIYPRNVTTLPDGSVWVAGFAQENGPNSIWGFVTSLNGSGTFMDTFGPLGTRIQNADWWAGGGFAGARFLAGGTDNRGPAAQAFGADGPDLSYGAQGTALFPAQGFYVGGAAVGPAGEVYLAGQILNGPYRMYVLRFAADGQLDLSWGQAGLLDLGVEGNVMALTVDAAGRVVGGGYLGGPGLPRTFAVFRLVP